MTLVMKKARALVPDPPDSSLSERQRLLCYRCSSILLRRHGRVTQELHTPVCQHARYGSNQCPLRASSIMIIRRSRTQGRRRGTQISCRVPVTHLLRAGVNAENLAPPMSRKNIRILTVRSQPLSPLNIPGDQCRIRPFVMDGVGASFPNLWGLHQDCTTVGRSDRRSSMRTIDDRTLKDIGVTRYELRHVAKHGRLL
jgi:hypothetical protein